MVDLKTWTTTYWRHFLDTVDGVLCHWAFLGRRSRSDSWSTADGELIGSVTSSTAILPPIVLRFLVHTIPNLYFAIQYVSPSFLDIDPHHVDCSLFSERKDRVTCAVSIILAYFATFSHSPKPRIPLILPPGVMITSSRPRPRAVLCELSSVG